MTRIANSLVSYLRYIGKTFWPENLCVPYPYPTHWPAMLVIAAALLLGVVSAWCIVNVRQKPYLTFGWLWFMGTLVPVIGIVQVGPQAMADRFSYVPSIGLFILVVWSVDEWFDRWPERKKFLPVAACLALAGCLMLTSIQLNYWQNSLSLFLHAVHVSKDNYVADNCLGRALDELGRPKEAVGFYAESVRITPRFPQAQFNLGMDLRGEGRLSEACEHLAAAVQLVPDNAEARYYLGTALMENGRPEDAVAQFTEALRLKPDFPQARRNLDEALAGRGRK
jgi:tetratricopeptide (TPR) repeat protein